LTWSYGLYLVAFLAAIFLARGLGPLFFIPLLLDFGFELCLFFDVLSGWDIRLVVAVFEFLWFVWVLALAGNLRKSTFVVMLVLDMAVMMKGILPSIQATGIGQNFWNDTSMAIIDVWQTSILVVIGSMVVRSTIVAKIKGEYVDILTNPKKRFLLPIGMWSFMLEMPNYLRPIIPDYLYDNRFPISANFLIYGWVALELPFYIMYKRLKKRYS
jgi:hypothetical protein